MPTNTKVPSHFPRMSRRGNATSSGTASGPFPIAIPAVKIIANIDIIFTFRKDSHSGTWEQTTHARKEAWASDTSDPRLFTASWLSIEPVGVIDTERVHRGIFLLVITHTQVRRLVAADRATIES